MSLEVLGDRNERENADLQGALVDFVLKKSAAAAQNGTPNVTVPDVVGQRLDLALSTLWAAKFKVTVVGPTDVSTNLRVVSQSLAAGKGMGRELAANRRARDASRRGRRTTAEAKGTRKGERSRKGGGPRAEWGRVGRISGEPLPEEARPIVEAMAAEEDRVVIRCRPYTTFAQPPRHLHNNDQEEEITQWVSTAVPWDEPDPT